MAECSDIDSADSEVSATADSSLAVAAPSLLPSMRITSGGVRSPESVSSAAHDTAMRDNPAITTGKVRTRFILIPNLTSPLTKEFPN